MALISRTQARIGRTRMRRSRLVGLAAALALAAGAVSSCQMTAGSALLVDGANVSEAAVQHDTAAFIAQHLTTPVTDSQAASYNRAQITYLVRHALIARAVAAKGIVISRAQLTEATAQIKAQGQNSDLAASLNLPNADQEGLVHDVVALQALVAGLPATGAEVGNVSVTAEGVPAATRDQAVALRSKYLADPATMDGDVKAAGANGVATKAYTLVQTPTLGAFGLYQPSSGQVLILPNADAYLVLRITGRAASKTLLTQALFSSASGLPDVFDLGALLVAQYQDSAGISVNPRYGVWDPASVRVVPGNDGL